MLLERIKAAAEQIVGRAESARGRGEGVTRQALVLPIIDAMGYDVYNPDEVWPEFDADFAIKKNGPKEKVDLAIFDAGIPKMFIEVKSIDVALDGHHGQLARYFNAKPSVHLGILTNGMEWRFFSDIENTNIMDSTPFHVSRLDATEPGIEVFAQFSKDNISLTEVIGFATDLIHTAKITSFLRGVIDIKAEEEPDEFFIRWILGSADGNGDEIYPGSVNKNTISRFKPIVKKAMHNVMRGVVRRSISAMEQGMPRVDEPAQNDCDCGDSAEQLVEEREEGNTASSSRRLIVTTPEELELFDRVKAMFDRSPWYGQQLYEPSQRRMLDAEIGYKDTTTYFGIFLNKPAWWIIRAYIEVRSRWVGFDLPFLTFKNLLPDCFIPLEPCSLAESRVAIDSVADIERLKDVVFAVFEREVNRHQQIDDISTVWVEAAVAEV